MSEHIGRAARIWLGLACLLSNAHAAELSVAPAEAASGKAARIEISAPGPGEAMLVPGGPHITASLPLPGNHFHGLDPQRGLVFSAEGALFEVRDLRAPDVALGRYQAAAPIAAVQTRAGDVLLSLDDGQVVVLDLRDPRAPQVKHEFKLPRAGQGVALSGQYVLQATGEAALLVWDISDPTQAQLVARYATTGATYDVVINEGRAYVAQHRAGLLILDVQDPAHPWWLGSTGQLGTAVKLALHGDSVWVGGTEGRVTRVDVFNAAQPSFTARQDRTGPVTALAVAGDEAWVATPAGLSLINFDAEVPQASNLGLDVGRGVNYGGQRRADVAGDRVFVADWFAGLHIYDVSDAQRPRLLSSLRTPGSAKGVVVRGGYAFVADDDHGLQVVDIREPTRPRIVAHLATPGLAYTPKLAGDLLYLASHRGGFQIIDVHEPAAPRLIADVPTPGMAWSLAVAGNTLYVADDAAGLLVYDVSDPAQPRALASYDAGGRLEEVLVRDGLAYLAYFDQGLKILDVSMPAEPQLLAELATPGNARGLDLQGDDLYIADWLAGVHVVNIADPARPQLQTSYDTPGAAWGVRAGDAGRAYVLDWWGGFAVLDLHGERPQLIRYAERGAALRDAAKGDYLYVAHGEGGLQIFDIKNPLNPTWVTGVELPAAALSVTLGETAAYVALAGGGLALIELERAGEARLSSVLKTERELDELQLAGTRLYARAGDTGWVFELDEPLQARPAAGAARGVGALWSEDGRLYTGHGAEAWRAIGVEAIETPRPAARLNGRRGLIVAIDAERAGELAVYRAGDTGLELLGSLNLGQPLIDVIWGEDVLYVTSALGMASFDMADPRRPKLIALQAGLGAPRGGGVHHRGVLYAGLSALRPPPPLNAALDDTGRAEIDLPADLPIGAYDLVYTPPQGAMQTRHNALTVRMPRFAKPKITPEEFQRLLQQHRAAEAQAAPPAR